MKGTQPVGNHTLTDAGVLFPPSHMPCSFIGGEKKVSLWVFSGLVAVAGVPLSFLTWYRSLYFAAKHDGMMRWLWYFLHMLINIVWCVWMFIGIKPNLGGYSAGIFEMITQFDHGGGARVHAETQPRSAAATSPRSKVHLCFLRPLSPSQARALCLPSCASSTWRSSAWEGRCPCWYGAAAWLCSAGRRPRRQTECASLCERLAP